MAKVAPKLEHPFPFDPTYGYTLDRLLQVPGPEEPADFAGFWRETYAEARQIPLEVASRQIDCPHPDYNLHEVEYNSLGGRRIGGWITTPKKPSDARGGWVVGHGYGGRDGAGYDLPIPDVPALYFCARGFHRSSQPDIAGNSAQHVIHGIERRETYVHRGCVADIWCAASALIELFPGAADELRYSGGSFGGGIGALALPWDERFHRAFLDIPSFGNHPLRLQLPCVGSGEAVRQYHASHPEVTKVLGYFDAASAARHVKIPVMVAAALFDPAVPPPGQFAIYNSLPARKELYVRSAAHFASRYEITDGRELRHLLADWFADSSENN